LGDPENGDIVALKIAQRIKQVDFVVLKGAVIGAFWCNDRVGVAGGEVGPELVVQSSTTEFSWADVTVVLPVPLMTISSSPLTSCTSCDTGTARTANGAKAIIDAPTANAA
jgi:hypothetical protein